MALEAVGRARYEARVEIRYEPGCSRPVSTELWIDGVSRQSPLGALASGDALGLVRASRTALESIGAALPETARWGTFPSRLRDHPSLSAWNRLLEPEVSH